MLALVATVTSLVAYRSPSATHDRRAQPAFLSPAVRGAVFGGAAVGLLSKALSSPLMVGSDGELAPVTEAEVKEAQRLWADSIASISKVYADKGDYVAAAGEAAGKLYGYGHGNVLFKPTKATKHPFRPTAEDAMSYFVGAEAMGNDNFKGEDAGFAINGGKGWKDVTFRNHQIDLNGPTAQAMGDYFFTDATSGDKVRVEYTIGYKRNADGNVRIYLHHSSVPYAA
jgi:hypothetical protein